MFEKLKHIKYFVSYLLIYFTTFIYCLFCYYEKLFSVLLTEFVGEEISNFQMWLFRTLSLPPLDCGHDWAPETPTESQTNSPQVWSNIRHAFAFSRFHRR
jgi:uncharacterized membrane protein